ncbi:MAG TPA: hypothetical protein VH351_14595 [Bryobacteraceae bacterium]|jgi:hypothetical protein|nr:hypothetical protein [Bryobacteraceae bacterium]
MRNSEVSAAGLIAAVVLVAVVFIIGLQHAAWTPTIVAAVVLAVLIVYDRAPHRSFAQSLAYAGACGFLLLTFAIYPVYQLVSGPGSPPVDAILVKPWLPAVWLAASLIFLAIDRFRLGSKPVVLEMAAVETRPPQIEIPVGASRVVEPAPAFTPSQSYQPAPASQPVAVPEQPAASIASTAPAPVEAKPPQPIAKGTPATIYLNLVGTGIACLRSVKAEHLGRDFYRITEAIPQGEAWEFQTGQIVRCRKKVLSSGKAMVAYEEAPRTS